MKDATLLIGFLVTAAVHAAPDTSSQPGHVVFRQQVRSLLVSKCLACHSGEKPRGGLDLTRRDAALKGDTGPAFKAGSALDSLLYQRIAAREMPPKNPLTPEQIEAFKKWIDAGAPYEKEPLALERAGLDWWSLRPVKRPAVPEIRNAIADIRNPIDQFIIAKRQAAKLEGSPEADRRTLIRRTTFDLTGLPPTPEEIKEFLDDQSPDAYEKVIDRLLASPAYGERWGRHWLDVVRFAESYGYEMNNPRYNAWPYRDYVIRSFNIDTSYPQFIFEQLAGDTISGADSLVQAATGFIVGGTHDQIGNAVPEVIMQQRMDDLDDIIAATGTTFLGLTINCCRCHDHKFDPLTQKDYYSLQAVFAGVKHEERLIRAISAGKPPDEVARLRRELARVERLLDGHEPLALPDSTEARRPPVNAAVNVDRIMPVEARFVRLNIFATYDRKQPCIDELEIWSAENEPRNVALSTAGAKVKVSSTLSGYANFKPEFVINGSYGNSSSWVSNEAGKGWIEIELAKPTRIERILWGRDREHKLTDRLVIDYTLETAADAGKWKTVASSQDRRAYRPEDPPEPIIPPGLTPAQETRYRGLLSRRISLLEEIPGEGTPVLAYAGTFAQPPATHILLGGAATRRGDTVTAGAPQAVGLALRLEGSAPEADRRLALARWLGSAENPLTARVMVNRVWHYHFGQGLVNTPSDYGFNGSPPSHPELLDWLASEFIRQGWTLKPMHRLIMTSATYRQSGQVNEKGLAIDRQNRLLWRMTPRRLEAEAIRDGMLAVSGRLDRQMGGSGYFMWEPSTNYVTLYKPKKVLEPGDYRRMVYMLKVRSQQDATFGLFDCPDASTARPKRTTSTTVLQALNLLNGSFVLEQSAVFAERLKREAGEDVIKQVELAFLLGFGRRPSEREITASVALVKIHGLAAFCRALFNTNEFVYAD
jgi:hypothetical protein